VRNKGISRGFEPCNSWRELEQQRRELSVGESQLEHPRQPEQQCWLPLGVHPVAQKQSRMTRHPEHVYKAIVIVFTVAFLRFMVRGADIVEGIATGLFFFCAVGE